MMLRSQVNQTEQSSSNVVDGEVGPDNDMSDMPAYINNPDLTGVGDRPEPRQAAPTQRYTEYRVDQLEQNFRSSVSTWRRCATKLEQLLSDSVDAVPLKQCRDRLVRYMRDVSDAYDRYQTLPSSSKSETIFARYDEIERDNHRLVKSTAELIKDINNMNGEESRSMISQRSGLSRHGSKASAKSCSSSASRRLDAAADAAALKAKLQCMELTERKRVEFIRAKTLEELRIAEAKLNVMTTESTDLSATPILPTENLTTAENVQRYLRETVETKPTLPQHQDPCVSQAALPQERYISPPNTKPSQPNVYANEFIPRDDVPSPYVPRDDAMEKNPLLDVISILSQEVSVGRLPPPEPAIFYGDPLSYPMWKASFDILIGHKGIPCTEKIFYLKKYLGGPAKAAVEGYFLLSNDDAFFEAMQLLEQRYGNPFAIAKAFRDKLETWQTIPDRDGPALRQFADFIRQCLRAMSSNCFLNCLNDEREMRKILSKLPDCLVLRWGRICSDWRERHGIFPPFNELVQFVIKEADIACDPITSIHAVRGKHSERNWNYRQKSGNATSFAVDSAESAPEGGSYVPRCLCCSEAHHLDDCKPFLGKPLQDRKQFARDKGLCFGCLNRGHRSRFCKRRAMCRSCSGKHPTSLHGDQRENAPNKEDHHTFATTLGAGKHVNLESSKCSMIVPVLLSHPDHPDSEIPVYALLDTQSDTSFILDDTCRELGLGGTEVKLRLSTMTSNDEMINSRKVTGLVVRGLDCDVSLTLPPVYTRGIMPANRNHIPTPETASRWPHLRRITPQLKPLMDVPIALLIGYNCSRALAPREVIPPEGNEPYGQRTDLGWGIVGIVDQENLEEELCDAVGVSHRILAHEVPMDGHSQVGIVAMAVVHRTSVKESFIPDNVARMMELDFNEDKSARTSLSQEDRKFVETISAGIHLRDDGHYEMPLPLKSAVPFSTDNRQAAFRRLMMLKRRLSANRTYREDYVAFMTEIISNGYAEEVPESDINPGLVWYIPHHGVYHPKRPTKIRVVFDCSAKCQGVSLNDRLLQGPDMTNGLHGILCRFRLESIAFMCDIKQMFHQFKVNQEHRDLLRFLWWPEGDYTLSPKEYHMNVHIFGAVSSPACANFGLKQVANDNENEFGHEAADFVRQNFYVDDGLKSTRSIEEAASLVQSTRKLCARGGLKLHKFVSNSAELIATVPQEDRGDGIRYAQLMNGTTTVERALGVYWAIEADCFTFRIVLKDSPLTRRGILATVSSVYDPLGLVAPVTLVGKQILQQMCIDGVDWDDPISDALRPRLEQWRGSLFHLESLEVKRCFKPGEFGTPVVKEVHHFSDASTKGYGQCSYLRLVDEHQCVHCSFVTGKARVTPLKAVTIPRLELTAALVSVKVSNFLQTELFSQSYLKDATEVFWTDSKVVLGYINNESRRFHVFVANRVQQIRESTTPSQWRFVKTEDNPADEGSRGLTAVDLVSTSKWTTGPDFLWDAEFELPEVNSDLLISPSDPEVRNCVVSATQTQCVRQGFDTERLAYFSDWFRAIRAVTNCLKFKRWRFVKTEDNPADEGSRGLTAVDLVSTSKWTTGPDFLWDAEFELPEVNSDLLISPSDPEVRNCVVSATQTQCVRQGFDTERLAYFPDWFRAIRAVANCLKFKRWRFVKTEDNPADEGSRGLTAVDLVSTSKWTTGPDFLWDAEFELPEVNSDLLISPSDPEVRNCVVSATQMQCVRQGFDTERLAYFSDWFRAIRAVANCLKFKRTLQNRLTSRSKPTTRSSCTRTKVSEQTTAIQLKEAETEVVRMIQQESFQEELKALAPVRSESDSDQGRYLGKSKDLSPSSPFHRLDPYIDEGGILRVGGRLRQSGFELNLQHPVILPRKHHLTKLILRHFHERAEHQGRGITTNEVRSNGFWVVGCSSAVSEIIHQCVQCRKMRRPLEEQKMADLPSDRLKPSAPFTYCGVDVFGPWMIRDGRKQCKRYGVLFTCLVSRAVHIETANTLTTDSFICALRRFVSIRGPILQLRSDRGTNFVGADRELRKAFREMDHQRIHTFLLKERCDYVDFKFNVPASSHMGGVWERQIRTVRSVLSSLLSSQGVQLDDESLRTFFSEAAAIVNSRPLSVSNLNDPTSAEPLTPNHLLTMKSKLILPPPGEFQRADIYCRKRWRTVQYMANEFWTRWKREYVQSLQTRSKWNRDRRNLKIGDVVLLKDESLARNHWPIAIVSEVFADDDARVRKVKLRVGDSTLNTKGKRTGKTVELERPIQKVVLLVPNGQ